MRTVPLCVLFLLLPVAGQAQNADWRAQLRADLVTVRDGKMMLEEFGLYELAFPGHDPIRMQVKVSSEAPVAGVISRDNFIALTTTWTMTVLITAMAAQFEVPVSEFMDALKMQELEHAIGTPDLELNFVMTAEGMEVEAVNTSDGTSERSVMRWAELFST
ncbi:MAG TPA: hypothetical protein VFZ24_04085 [Longimicrobiales bacterium]